MLLLDVTIVNVALPSIERDLGVDFSDLQWVIDAYVLTLAGLVLAAGSLADMVGRAVASGGTGRALQAVPPADRDKVAHAAHHAFVTGFNTVALVSVAVAAVGSLGGVCAGTVAGLRGRRRPGCGSAGTGAGVGGAGFDTRTHRMFIGATSARSCQS
jgi:MFS family permease